jgi:D-sedoheptulose 7-phosphate isomerase
LESFEIDRFIKGEFEESLVVLNEFLSNAESIEKIVNVAKVMSTSIQNKGKIISFGNGGSMSDAMHFAEELSGKYRNNRRALPALAISDIGYMTCVSNDYGYDKSFSRFLEALGQKEDIAFGISTSGNSQNVIEAFKIAKSMGISTVSLTGKDGGELAKISDYNINVRGAKYADRIQEVHIKIIHCLIGAIEKMVL